MAEHYGSFIVVIIHVCRQYNIMCVGIFVCRRNVKNVHFYGCFKAVTTVLRSLSDYGSPVIIIIKKIYCYLFSCVILTLKKNG